MSVAFHLLAAVKSFMSIKKARSTNVEAPGKLSPTEIAMLTCEANLKCLFLSWKYHMIGKGEKTYFKCVFLFAEEKKMQIN